MRPSTYALIFGLSAGIGCAQIMPKGEERHTGSHTGALSTYADSTYSVQQEYTIHHMYQKNSAGCGNTCLAMLGYEGHSPDMGNVIDPDSLGIIVPAAREIGNNEPADYSTPHMQMIRWKNAVATHWVVRYGDEIYCPLKGIMPADEYMRNHVLSIQREFEVPFRKRN